MHWTYPPERSYVESRPHAPQSRPGRYAELTAGELADAVITAAGPRSWDLPRHRPPSVTPGGRAMGDCLMNSQAVAGARCDEVRRREAKNESLSVKPGVVPFSMSWIDALDGAPSLPLGDRTSRRYFIHLPI